MTCLILALVSVGPKTSESLCGAYCLSVAMTALDESAPRYSVLEGRLGVPSAEGYSLADLAGAAEEFHFHTLPVKTNLDNLARRPGPFACIALLKRGHYVLIKEPGDGTVEILDPPSRTSLVPEETLVSQWDGTALLVAKEPLIREEDLPRPFPWMLASAGMAALGVCAGVYAIRRRLRCSRPS